MILEPDDTPIQPHKEARLFDMNDLNSPTWRKLREHLQEELQSLRIRNDAELDQITTARVRGEIKRVKSMLALGESRAPADGADEE